MNGLIGMGPAGRSLSSVRWRITLKGFWVRLRGLEPLRHPGGNALLGRYFPKELYSEEKTVPIFVPCLIQKLWHKIANHSGRKAVLENES